MLVQNVEALASWIVEERASLEEEISERQKFSFFAKQENDCLKIERDFLQGFLE